LYPVTNGSPLARRISETRRRSPACAIASGYEAAGDPPFTEVYGEDFDPVRLEGVIEVRVPLKDQ
jgi:hypothetical protein